MAGEGEYQTERYVDPYIFDVIQRIEDPENIQTILDSFLRKIVDSIISVGELDLESPVATPHLRITRITDTIGTTN